MSKANESFSAFLDGEATELDIQRLLKAMDEQPGITQEWHGISKIKASLQGDTLVDTALSAADVSGSMPTEPRPSWHKRLMQGGIAAAVAVVMVSVMRLPAADLSQPDVARLTVAPTESDSAADLQQQFAAQQRLTQFLKTHAEQASFTTGHVVVPAELNWIEGAQ